MKQQDLVICVRYSRKPFRLALLIAGLLFVFAIMLGDLFGAMLFSAGVTLGLIALLKLNEPYFACKHDLLVLGGSRLLPGLSPYALANRFCFKGKNNIHVVNNNVYLSTKTLTMTKCVNMPQEKLLENLYKTGIVKSRAHPKDWQTFVAWLEESPGE